MNMIKKAFVFSKKKHDATGEQYGDLPYIVHPVETHYILSKMMITDDNLLAAALLHDTLEDTDTTHEELEREFNEDVADLVKEVTKDDKGNFSHLKTERGLTLKAADRLANITNLSSLEDKKRRKLIYKYSYCLKHEGDHLRRGK